MYSRLQSGRRWRSAAWSGSSNKRLVNAAFRNQFGFTIAATRRPRSFTHRVFRNSKSLPFSGILIRDLPVARTRTCSRRCVGLQRTASNRSSVPRYSRCRRSVAVAYYGAWLPTRQRNTRFARSSAVSPERTARALVRTRMYVCPILHRGTPRYVDRAQRDKPAGKVLALAESSTGACVARGLRSVLLTHPSAEATGAPIQGARRRPSPPTPWYSVVLTFGPSPA